MHTIKSVLALSIAALALSSSLAQAGATMLDPPKTSVTTPTIVLPQGPGNDASPRFDPSDFFTQDFIDRQPKKAEPSQFESHMGCSFMQFGGEGQFFGLAFKNTGDTVIPKGAKFVIILPDGKPMVFEVPYNVDPGWGFMSAPLFDGGFPENWTCQMSFISA